MFCIFILKKYAHCDPQKYKPDWFKLDSLITAGYKTKKAFAFLKSLPKVWIKNG